MEHYRFLDFRDAEKQIERLKEKGYKESNMDIQIKVIDAIDVIVNIEKKEFAVIKTVFKELIHVNDKLIWEERKDDIRWV